MTDRASSDFAALADAIVAMEGAWAMLGRPYTSESYSRASQLSLSNRPRPRQAEARSRVPSSHGVKIQRNVEIARLYVEEHKTMGEIASTFGISGGRVRQVLVAQRADIRSAQRKRRSLIAGGGR